MLVLLGTVRSIWSGRATRCWWRWCCWRRWKWCAADGGARRCGWPRRSTSRFGPCGRRTVCRAISAPIGRTARAVRRRIGDDPVSDAIAAAVVVGNMPGCITVWRTVKPAAADTPAIATHGPFGNKFTSLSTPGPTWRAACRRVGHPRLVPLAASSRPAVSSIGHLHDRGLEHLAIAAWPRHGAADLQSDRPRLGLGCVDVFLFRAAACGSRLPI